MGRVCLSTLCGCPRGLFRASRSRLASAAWQSQGDKCRVTCARHLLGVAGNVIGNVIECDVHAFPLGRCAPLLRGCANETTSTNTIYSRVCRSVGVRQPWEMRI